MGDNQTKNDEIVAQESLQPKRIGKDEKAYQGVLDIERRLREGDATNIALTGPYGSGKSSILITLKEDFPKYNYLNISLATLTPSDNLAKDKLPEIDKNSNEDLSKLNQDRLIEYSILQQLIYIEKQETLPNSRLKRIFHLPANRTLKVSIAIILAFISLIVVWEPSFLTIAIAL